METLILPATIIIASAMAIWVITSKKFRKEVGTSISRTIVTSANNIADGTERATVLDELEFLEELADLGHSSAETVVEARKNYRAIVKGV